MRKPWRLGGVAVGIGLALALSVASAAQAVSLPAGFRDEAVFELNQGGFEQPANFKFAPDGRTFVALKGGKIVVYPAGSKPDATPDLFANLAKQVYDNSDHGLLGLALDPKFDEGRPYVYALYSYNHELGAPAGEVPKWPHTGSGSSEFEGDYCPGAENTCLVSGRLVRLTAEGDHAKESGGVPEEDVLLEGWCQQSTSHSIGNLQFGPEGALYASGGEGAVFTAADYGQFNNLCGDPTGTKGTPLSGPGAEGGSLRSQSVLRPNGQVLLNGTVVRIDPDTGEGWPGNPFSTSLNANARRIIGFGFRNPFRFTVNSRLGEVFVGNVGADTDEEIDRFPIGASQAYNSGWPCYEGLGPNPLFQTLDLNACNRLYDTPNSTSPPFFFYAHGSPVAPGDNCESPDGSAISGSAFYEGGSYPSEYEDALFFADSVRGCIYVMHADADGEPDPLAVTPFLSEGIAYPGVDLERGPDGSIYYASLYENSINRLAYDPGAPTAHLEADKTWGDVPLTVHFDASKSSGPAGDPLAYAWDLDGDGEFDDGTGPTISETYGAATNVTAAVRVTDLNTSKSAVASVKLFPGDAPPQVQIEKPVPTDSWSVGSKIEFSGSATDSEGAPIPAEKLYWKARLLHCPIGPEDCHEHPLQIFPGVESGEFTAPDHDYPSYLTLFLSAIDNRGLSGEATVKFAARPVALQLQSEPPGIAVVAGIKTLTTPAVLQVIEDSPTTIAAPPTAVVGGVTYDFQSWSDGGDRVHTLPANGPGTFTAVYAAEGGSGGGGDEGGGGGSSGGSSGGSGSGGGGGGGKGAKPVAPRIGKRPPQQTTSRSARIAFSGEKGERFLCRLDGAKFKGCKSPRTYRGLKPSSHVFRVYGVTSAGVRTPTNVVRWRILKG